MEDTIKTSLIVAMAENNCIGKDNQMPWHISEDLKRFKSLTMGHPVIMGRKTFDSILGYLNKPLPERTNIIVSRSGYQTQHDALIYDNLGDAITRAKQIAHDQNKDEIFIIGGAQIYTQSLGLADQIHLTKVHQSVDGDAFFPYFDTEEWNESQRIDNAEHEPPYSFITLTRR
tara:strand:- start:6261 stop:6779 length:519 start_codon:yes stop_codon:yes gene_type:complete